MREYLDSGHIICYSFANDVSTNMEQLSEEQRQLLITEGSQELEVLEDASKPIATLLSSENRELIHNALVVDNHLPIPRSRPVAAREVCLV